MALTLYSAVEPGVDLVIQRNRFLGNDFGLDNDTGDEIDATENWWGDASGPTHSNNADGTGDEISDDVLYDPWYIDEDMTELSD